MALTVTEEERRALEAAQAKSRAVRHWRRYQAVLLRADGLEVAEVARVLRCTETSVCNWTAAWRGGGGAGRAEGGHPGTAPCLGPHGGRGGSARAAGRRRPTGTWLRRHRLDGPFAAHRAGAAGVDRRRAHHPPHAAPLGLALEAPQVRPRTTRSGIHGEKKPSLSKRQPSSRRVGRRGWWLGTAAAG